MRREIMEFNTGRRYAEEGQVVRVTLTPGGALAFADVSRRVDGIVAGHGVQRAWGNGPAETEELVMEAYDRGLYRDAEDADERDALEDLRVGGDWRRGAVGLADLFGGADVELVAAFPGEAGCALAFRSAEADEFVVLTAGPRGWVEGSDYHTDDVVDALGTAREMAKGV